METYIIYTAKTNKNIVDKVVNFVLYDLPQEHWIVDPYNSIIVFTSKNNKGILELWLAENGLSDHMVRKPKN